MKSLRMLGLAALFTTFSALTALAAPAQPATQPAGAEPTVDLPVTRVMLFSSGVGYFEHSGFVQGDATMRLMFKTEQINDVLKSMVLMDSGGGQVTSVSYSSNEPVQRALRSFGVDISANPTLPQLLNQLRGARVDVTTPDRITGAILNVDTRTKVIGTPPTQITEYVLNLVTSTGIRAIPLDSISSLQLADSKLQEELNQALTLLVTARDRDRKPVDIRFTGAGRRNVMVGYLVETPVWKTSYRLDLSGAKPLLQGWAIVENASESDWKDVRLSLTSGRPISFTQDLYTPLYVQRPVVVPQYFASLAPKIYDDGIDMSAGLDRLREASVAPPAAAPAPAGRGGRGGGGGAGGGGGRGGGAPGAGAGGGFGGGAAGQGQAQESLAREGTGEIRMQLTGAGVQAAAAGAEAGELFQFTMSSPVVLTRRRSAMIPIVNQEVTGEKVSIYNPSTHPKNPLNGAYFTNSTNLKLLAGPVTVLDAGSYAGDAQFDHTEKNDKRLISYAVDMSLNIDPSSANENRITAVTITRGVVTITRLHTWTQTYRVENKAAADKKLIIEYPFTNGRKLVEPSTFEEKTPNLYRFRVPVRASSTGNFVVREEQTYQESIGVLQQDPGSFTWLTTTRETPEPVKRALQRAIELKNALTDAERELNELNRQVNEIKNGQDRIRRNIETAGRDTPQGRNWLEQLSQQENQIAALEGRPGIPNAPKGSIEIAREKVLQKRTDLDNYLKDLTVGG